MFVIIKYINSNKPTTLPHNNTSIYPTIRQHYHITIYETATRSRIKNKTHYKKNEMKILTALAAVTRTKYTVTSVHTEEFHQYIVIMTNQTFRTADDVLLHGVLHMGKKAQN
jgi:hypothetical protein